MIPGLDCPDKPPGPELRQLTRFAEGAARPSTSSSAHVVCSTRGPTRWVPAARHERSSAGTATSGASRTDPGRTPPAGTSRRSAMAAWTAPARRSTPWGRTSRSTARAPAVPRSSYTASPPSRRRHPHADRRGHEPRGQLRRQNSRLRVRRRPQGRHPAAPVLQRAQADLRLQPPPIATLPADEPLRRQRRREPRSARGPPGQRPDGSDGGPHDRRAGAHQPRRLTRRAWLLRRSPSPPARA